VDTAVVVGGGTGVTIDSNYVSGSDTSIAYVNEGMNWMHENCEVGLAWLAYLLAGPANATIHNEWPDLWKIAQNNATECNPYGNRVVNNVVANTTKFMTSATFADVMSWGGEISNNTCATPPAANEMCTCFSTTCTCPLHWVPTPACPMNATSPRRAHIDCEFEVQIGLFLSVPPPAGNSTPYHNITATVHANAEDCFRIEGCGTRGPSAPSCMSKFNTTSRYLLSLSSMWVGVRYHDITMVINTTYALTRGTNKYTQRDTCINI
jgi:hypothetical protein